MIAKQFQSTENANPEPTSSLGRRSHSLGYSRLVLAFIVLWLPTTVQADSQLDFTNDIIPVFTQLGCNAGSCHGSAAGRGEFKLSLYGSNPQSDFSAIVYQLEGRRVNHSRPEESLILLKPSEAISHGGGYLIEEDDQAYRLLRDWIAQGTPQRSTRSLRRIEVSPQAIVEMHLEESVQLVVTARYDDSTTRDVTRWTVFAPEDDSAITIAPSSHQLTALRRGRHLIVARYLDQVIPIEVIVPLNDNLDVSADVEQGNWIDALVMQRLQRLKLPASPPASDDQWVRRVTLDLTGRLPVASEVTFAGNRENYVDRLLATDAFVEYWTLQLAKLLRVGSKAGDAKATQTYHDWLAQQIRDQAGYDSIAHSLLTASGDTHTSGPANFYRTVDGPREQAELFSEVFMGSRLRCANCHNHPLDRWTQDDYHGLAAIFAKVRMDQVVKLNDRGEVIHPATLEPAIARLPGEATAKLQASVTDHRESLAGWLTGSNNPYFARGIVNRLWYQMMGRGLVHPVDDFRATNPPTHPELLDALADDFVQHGYSIQRTLRWIASSSTYARSSLSLAENLNDDRFYSHAMRRPLSAEVLADAISDVLDVAEPFGDLPLGTRAVTLASPKTPSQTLDILGRCGRDTTCDVANEPAGGLKQMLHLLNGELLNGRINNPQGRLVALSRLHRNPMHTIESFYVSSLNRSPTASEATHWKTQIDRVGEAGQDALLEDFVWALLTCEEFVTNH